VPEYADDFSFLFRQITSAIPTPDDCGPPHARAGAARIISANCNYNARARAGRSGSAQSALRTGRRRRVSMDGWFNEEISRPDRIETECRRNKLGEWASERGPRGRFQLSNITR